MTREFAKQIACNRRAFRQIMRGNHKAAAHIEQHQAERIAYRPMTREEWVREMESIDREGFGHDAYGLESYGQDWSLTSNETSTHSPRLNPRTSRVRSGNGGPH